MSDLLSKLQNWTKRFFFWLMRGWFGIVAVAIIVLSLWIPLLTVGTIDAIRYSGLLMQLLGLGTVAFGIRDTRRKFGKMSLLELISHWFCSYPRLRPKVHRGLGTLTSHDRLPGKGINWQSAEKNPTLESRLTAVEANLRNLHDKFIRSDSENQKTLHKLEKNLQEESNERREQDQELHYKIDFVSTDGLHLAMVGVVWLSIGVILSSIPQELLSLILYAQICR